MQCMQSGKLILLSGVDIKIQLLPKWNAKLNLPANSENHLVESSEKQLLSKENICIHVVGSLAFVVESNLYLLIC